MPKHIQEMMTSPTRRPRVSPMRKTSDLLRAVARSAQPNSSRLQPQLPTQPVGSPSINRIFTAMPIYHAPMPVIDPALSPLSNSIDDLQAARYDGVTIHRIPSARRASGHLSQNNVSFDDLNDSRVSDVHRFNGVRLGPPRDSDDQINPERGHSSNTVDSYAHLVSESQATITGVDLNASSMTKTVFKNGNVRHARQDPVIGDRDNTAGLTRNHEKRRNKRRLSPCLKLCLLLSCLLCLALLGGIIAAAILLSRTTTTTTRTTTTSTSTSASTSTSSSSTTSTTSTSSSTSTTSSTSSTSSTTATTTTTSTVSTSTITTTTTFACLFTTDGLLESFGNTAQLTWTCYSYNYTANKTSATLRFSSATDNAQKDWYLDQISVVENGVSPMNVLLNGDFESGPSVGWQFYSCSSTCSAGLTTSATCYTNGGQCYHNKCTPATNKQFVEQSFTTTIGATYTISFCLLKGGSGVGPGIDFLANVL